MLLNKNWRVQKKELESAKQDKTNKDTALENAKQVLESAKKEVTAQQTKVNEAQDAVTNQQKLVDQLRTDKEQAQTKIAQGSKGFFEAYGYTDALKILEKQSTLNGGYTNIGAENDATSLENFKRALSMVRYGNKLRTTDANVPGLSDLTVNPTLFAISQVQLNATANGKIFGHSQLYRVGENIAAATYKSNDELLFNGWYTEEKQVYDYITAKGWTEDDLYNDAAKYKEVQQALNQKYPQVGHYTNIINKDYTTTGTAYIYSKDTAPDGWECNAGQVFDFVQHSSYITIANTMTIDEFEAKFNEYYNKLMNADSVLSENQTKLDGLKADLEKQKALFATKQATQSSAQTNVQTATDQATSAQNAVTAAQSKVDTKQARLDQLMKDSAASGLLNEINSLKASKKNAETNDLVNAQKVLSAAQKEKMIADQNVVDKTALVNDAKSNLDLKKKVLAESNKGVELAQSNLEIAKKNLDEKTNALKTAKSDESSKKGLYDSSKSSLDRLNAKLSELNKDLLAAKNSASTKENTLSNTKKAYDSAIQKQSDVKKLKQDIVSKKSVIDSYQKDIQSFKEAISKLNASIKQLENEEALMKVRIAEIQKVMDAYDKLCANPNGVLNVVSSDDEIINGLYAKLNSMKEAYNAYLKAVDEFNKAEAINNENKKELDIATENYDKAKAELKKAQDELDAYLKVTGIPGWHKLDNDWYFVDSNGHLVTNKWQGNYYLESDGKMATNKWIGDCYVGSDGLWIENKWIQSGNQWWYRHGDGSYTTNDFETISGQTYYFDVSGYMVTGWKQIKSNWYFFNASGAMLKSSWQGNYYLGSDGVMLTNAFTPDGYYVGADGVYVRNQKITAEDKDYYLNADGKVAKNQWSGDYYLDSNGNPYINRWAGSYWCGSDGKYVKSSWVDNNKYYVGANGIYVTNQWVGDYYLNGSGVKATNAWVGDYWCGEDGKYMKSSWVDNGKYYVGSNGVYVTNQWIGDYYLNGSGLVTNNAWVGNYWCGSDGKYVKSAWVDNNRYYVNENGVYVAGAWQQDSKGWKYHAGSVYAKDITLNINGTSYTFDSNGYMK